MKNKRLKILLLDFWSEKNRGDAAMQQALIRLTHKCFNDAELVVCTEYGVNQFPDALTHFEYTIKEKVNEIIGGLRFTYHPFSGGSIIHQRPIRIILSLITSLSGLLLIVALMIRIPPAFLMKILPSKFWDSLKHFVDCDLVIWNGRNFRGSSFLKEPYSLFTLFFHPLICIFLKKPIACIGASVWQLKNPISRILAKFVFKQTMFISVREENSLNTLSDLLGSDTRHIVILPDLSFYTLRSLSNPPSTKPYSKEPKIGITLMDWYDSGLEARNRYIRAMRHLINFLVEEMNAQILIMPQVTYTPESIYAIMHEVLKEVDDKSKISIVEEEMSIQDLVDTYADLDFLVATRMHSAIFALSAGTPALAVAYDYGAKWGIFKMLGVESIVINFNDVNEQPLLNKFLWCWSQREILLQTAEDNLNECYTKVVDNLRLVKEAYKKYED